MSKTYPIPAAFRERMRAELGCEAEAFFEALEQPYLRGLRLNPRKPVTNLNALVDGIGEAVPWWLEGRYLDRDSAAGGDPLHEAGAYYLQEPSAMAAAAELNVLPGERVLDLCAAPGGKGTQLADRLQGRGLLVLNEPVASRARVLSGNVERMGITNALAVSAEPEALMRIWPEAFDAILTDAPCSGEGMFRRHPETRAEWNESAPEGCAARQLRILRCAAAMLKPGGRLVYSTCTFNAAENEGVAERLTECKLIKAFHLYPHRVQGEGHFVASFVKPGCPSDDGSELFAPARERLKPPDRALLSAYDKFADGFFQGASAPVPNACLGGALICAPDLPMLSGVKVLRAGLQLGAIQGKTFAPDHALAMAQAPFAALPGLALNRDQARAYLRGETLPAPETLRGYALAVYQGLPLGFGKASEGWFKNHYPKGLRKSI